MYNLQLASCLAALKLQVNKFETQLYLDISTSFVIYVTRLLTDTIPYARDDIRILLSTLYAYVSSDGSFPCTILASLDRKFLTDAAYVQQSFSTYQRRTCFNLLECKVCGPLSTGCTGEVGFHQKLISTHLSFEYFYCGAGCNTGSTLPALVEVWVCLRVV